MTFCNRCIEVEDNGNCYRYNLKSERLRVINRLGSKKKKGVRGYDKVMPYVSKHMSLEGYLTFEKQFMLRLG